MVKFFENIAELPPDPIFGLVRAFREDKREGKVDAIAGTYRGEDLQPYLFPSVKQAEKLLLERERDKEYLPIDGDPTYLQLTKELVFGKFHDLRPLYGVQTLGGTGALRLAADFLHKLGAKVLYLGEPTWANHRRIFESASLEVKSFPYYDIKHHRIDFEKMASTFEKMAPKSLVLMQTCCHNPTATDLSLSEWQKLFQIAAKRGLFFIFDLAYQGFGDGVREDVKVLELFLEGGGEGVVCVSHSKTFGLYAERVGALFFLCDSEKQRGHLQSQICPLIRGNYSNPPCHGVRIVTTLFQTPELKRRWQEELLHAREKIQEIRNFFAQELSMDFLRAQKGMFAFMGLSEEFVRKLKEQYALYLPKDGRINAAGINLTVAKMMVEMMQYAQKNL